MDKKIFAFVLMPFSSEFDDIYKFGIKEPASEMDVHAERVDEQLYREGILDRIYRQIEIADIIIADMSGKNANVFYEVGYAHAKDKLCILLTSKAEDIPFDLKHKRHIVYNGSIDCLKRLIIKDIIWAKKEIENVNKSNINLSSKKITGMLEKTNYMAKADLSIKLDLTNDSSKDSPEIEAAYIYSGEGWTLYQDRKECSSSNSDVRPFSVRHFLNVPVRRLRRSQWVQISYNAKKTVAFSFKGEEIKDSYRINGKSILRLVTSEGYFDYEFSIDVVADDIPF